MPSAYDFASTFAGLPSMLDSVMGGFKASQDIKQAQFQQQQQQAALAQQQQMMQDLQAASQDHSLLPSMMVKYPALADKLKVGWEAQNADQQNATLTSLSPIYAALQSNSPDVAEQLARQRADALRNSGQTEKAAATDAMADQIKADPTGVSYRIAASLAALPGGDKIITNVMALQKQPADLRKANADATVAEVTAGNAPVATELSNQKTVQEIKASQLQGQIATLNAQIAQANSETERGRLTLERDKLTAELAKTGMEQGQAAQSALDNNVQALSTVQGLLKHPGFDTWIGKPGSFDRKVLAAVPGTDAYDFEAQLQVLRSQQFLNNIQAMKGTGQLSDAEGKKIDSALANLDPNQSYKQLKTQLETVRTVLEKAQSRLYNSGQLPTTKGQGAAVMAHPVYGQVTENTINALIRQHPGATRESVLQFLRSTGGQ